MMTHFVMINIFFFLTFKFTPGAKWISVALNKTNVTVRKKKGNFNLHLLVETNR